MEKIALSDPLLQLNTLIWNIPEMLITSWDTCSRDWLVTIQLVSS